MTVEKAGGYISELEFNTGEKVQINRNDIVVFVGPNNAGKSQSLKDIYTLTSKKLPSVVISNVKITKSNLPFESLLDSVSVGKNRVAILLTVLWGTASTIGILQRKISPMSLALEISEIYLLLIYIPKPD